jgi:type I restriction enzyme S subunit
MNNRQAQLPEGWEVKKLGEIVDVLDNLRKPITKRDRIEGEFPYYGATGILSYVNDFIFSEKLVLVGEDGAKWDSGEDTAFIVEGKYWVNNHAHAIRPQRNIALDEWLVFYLNFSDLKPFVTGMTVPKLNQEKLRSIPIPLPPVLEQQRIVSTLDECFAAINKAKANTEQNLKNAKELFESYLQGVFERKGEGWEEKQLKDIALAFGRGKSKHRPRNWEGLYGGDYPFIQTGEVRNASKYISEHSQSYNEVGLKQSKLWEKGTICITIAANIAETAILGFDACFPDSIIGLQVDLNKADLDFTYYLLQFFKSELQKLGKGSAQDNINLGTFENKLFPFPKSVMEQQAIVRRLDALRTETQKLEAVYQKKINDLEELKKSILQKAFAGELTAEKSRRDDMVIEDEMISQ